MIDGRGLENTVSFSLSETADQKADNHLVTFALFAYNQERFIKQAVEGAFSQTYSPLEIILSDDCSTDQTFEIIKEMATAYSGPHKVLISQNVKNLGIGGHVNKVFEMSIGELIIMAAGDDISAPERTNTIHQCWIEFGKPSAVSSRFIRIDEFGHQLDEQKETNGAVSKHLLEDVSFKNLRHNVFLEMGTIHGSTAAYSKEVLSSFTKLPSNLVQEDDCLVFRAQLLRGALQIPSELIKYRFHNQNVWNRKASDDELSERNSKLRKIRSKVLTRSCQKNDLEIFKNCGWLRPDEIRLLILELSRQIKYYTDLEVWHTGTGFSKYRVLPNLIINNRPLIRKKTRRLLKKTRAFLQKIKKL